MNNGQNHSKGDKRGRPKKGQKMNLWNANSAFCRQKTPSATHRKSSLENMAKSHQIARTSKKSPDFESRLKHVAKI
jgi:hypothetical protein